MVNHPVTVERVASCIGNHRSERLSPFLIWRPDVVRNRQRLPSTIRDDGHHPAFRRVGKKANRIQAVCVLDDLAFVGEICN